MAGRTATIAVYVETGSKRTFAGAIDWPGWCRSGRDERSALTALAEAAPRYARALRGTRLGFRAPTGPSGFRLAERLAGTATTDFGAPDAAPRADAKPMREPDARRARTLLEACWRAFDVAAEAAEGRKLRTGPRGGGRALDAIVRHVLGADAGYLRALAWSAGPVDEDRAGEELARVRAATLEALAAAARGDLPERGPRGGKRWAPRYFVRRSAWHVLDHAWEIEDRAL
jgi:hypothetical protein